MSDQKIAVGGVVYQLEQSTTAVPIAYSGNNFTLTLPTAPGGIATLTFTSATTLTFAPAAGTMPNFFFTLTGATGQTGGTLNGPIFRILSIDATQKILTFYTSVTAATVTSASFYPVFIPNFIAALGTFAAQLPGVAANSPGSLQASCQANVTTGANCVVNYYPDNTSIIYDQTTGATPTTAPTSRTLIPVSSQGQVWFDGTGSTAIVASGSAGTTRVSVIE